MIERDRFKAAIEKALLDKGKRNFTQSVEIIFSFKNVDFSKPDNRLNVEVALPKGRGKTPKVWVFAEQQMALEAKNAGADTVVGSSEITKMAQNKKALKKLAREYVFFAQPSFMVTIGKTLGQVLASRGKLPKPIIGASVSEMIELAKRTVKIASKGKNLPVAQCAIGTEKMSVDDLVENAEAVYSRVAEKVGSENIKRIYVKLTMGKCALV
ncbi:MAG: 50S ribosomal protein L1 [Candidatus Anstonellales archaeon]